MAEISKVLLVEEGLGCVGVVDEEFGDVLEEDLPGNEVTVEFGVEGPPGPPGPAGPAGANGGATTRNFATPSDIWTHVHNLGYPPAVSLYDPLGAEIFGRTTANDGVSTTVEFFFPTAGRMDLS